MFSRAVLFLFIISLYTVCGFFERKQRVVLPGKSAFNPRDPAIRITKPGDFFPIEFELTYPSDDDGAGAVSVVIFTTDHAAIKRSSNLANVYITDGTDQIKKVTDSNVKMERYTSKKGHTATLFNSSYIEALKLKVTSQYKFSMLATIGGVKKDTHIVPNLFEYRRYTSKGSVISTEFVLGLGVRTVVTPDLHYGKDFALPDDEVVKVKAEFKSKRAVGGQPVAGYVEAVVVADYSAYQKHMINANSVDQAVVLLYMKIFYSHLINTINQRYINTFSSDADITIQVRLTNFVIQTALADSTWSDPATVGIPGNATATYNGKEIIVATPTLTAFKNYMNGRTFPFTYDHAFGMTDKDIWSDTGSDPSTRTGVAGFAYVGAVCGTSRYSINEDRGFSSIIVLAHELGHNLGAYHDGDATYASACATTDNYIMTPVIGASSVNLLNFFRFSPCSIATFKSTLLDAGGPFKSTFSCLTNIPVSAELETSYFNTSLAGQIWDANAQCKFLYGTTSDSDSCAWALTQAAVDICTKIFCSTAGGYCWSSSGRGALDGTTCGTNQVCFNGVCQSNSITRATNFPASPCGTNPCLNGAACVTPAIGSFYICNCPAGFTGQLCEVASATTVAGATTQAPTTIAGATTQAATTTVAGASTQSTTTLAGASTQSGAATTTVLALAGKNAALKLAAVPQLFLLFQLIAFTSL